MSTFEQETTLKNVFEDQNGWFRVETDTVGRLDTKDPALAREAYKLWQRNAPVRVKGKEDRVNKDGRWFTNRYLNAIQEASANGGGGAFGNLEPEIPKRQPQQQGQRSQHQEDVEPRIVRTACAKLAVWTLPFLPEAERSPASQVRIAEFWRSYIYGGARAVGVAPLAGPAPPAEPDPGPSDPVFAGSGDAAYQPPGDDDIPF